MTPTCFNLRVYGLLLNDRGQVLVTDEYRMGMNMTKFPGGGLIFGEGTLDCVKREFREELNIEISVGKHFYTTDYFQLSAFNKTQQLISIYYIVETSNPSKIITKEKMVNSSKLTDGDQSFRWITIDESFPQQFTFPIDKEVAKMLSELFKSSQL